MVDLFFFFQAEDGIRDGHVTGVQTCALPIWTVTCRPPGELRYTRIRPRTTSAASGSDPARYTVVPAGKSARSPSARSWLASSAGSSARKLCAMASSTSRSTTPTTLGRIELQQQKRQTRAIVTDDSLGHVGATRRPRSVRMGTIESRRGYPSQEWSCPWMTIRSRTGGPGRPLLIKVHQPMRATRQPLTRQDCG